MVITPESVMKIYDAVQAAQNNGANQFSFTFFIDNIESKDKNWEYLEKHNPFALIDAFLCQTERLSAITDDWWIEYSFPICAYTEEQLKALEGRLAGPCQIHLMNAITVDTQMDLLPCDMYATIKLGRIGREISSSSELEAWVNSSNVNSIMSEIRSWPSSRCSTCKHLERCYGGCPILWKNYSFEALMDFKSSYHHS